MRYFKLKHRIVKKYGYAPHGPVLYRPGIKYRKMVFEINAHDDDDHPSVPHGDSLNHHFHLDLRNGAVWEERKRIKGYLSKKEFEKLKQDQKLKALIIEAQAYHRAHHPERIVEPIPWCEVFFATPSCRFLQNKNVGFCTYKM